MSLENRYSLELHWDKVEYKKGVCYFYNAYFCGPVLKLAEKISADDNIHLDFYKQYYVVVENIYIGKLSWGDVVYKENKVFLDKCKLQHKTELNKAPKFSINDYILIDCSNHDREIHDFFTTYKAQVINQDTQVYIYEK